jgi:hypothetical protein
MRPRSPRTSSLIGRPVDEQNSSLLCGLQELPVAVGFHEAVRVRTDHSPSQVAQRQTTFTALPSTTVSRLGVALPHFGHRPTPGPRLGALRFAVRIHGGP